jgi:hypothetical protein
MRPRPSTPDGRALDYFTVGSIKSRNASLASSVVLDSLPQRLQRLLDRAVSLELVSEHTNTNPPTLQPTNPAAEHITKTMATDRSSTAQAAFNLEDAPVELLDSLARALNAAEIPCVLWGKFLWQCHGVPTLWNVSALQVLAVETSDEGRANPLIPKVGA